MDQEVRGTAHVPGSARLEISRRNRTKGLVIQGAFGLLLKRAVSTVPKPADGVQQIALPGSLGISGGNAVIYTS